MTTTAFSPAPSYVREAFLWQYNVILLGGAALFSLASASAMPLVIGGACEVAWLVVGPLLPAFRRHVEPAPSSAPVQEARDTVPPAPPSQDRAGVLARAIAEIRTPRGATDAALAPSLLKLDAVVPAFTRLSALHARLEAFLRSTDQNTLEAEVGRLNELFNREKDVGVRVTLRQAINGATKRLEQRERALATSRAAQLKLEMVEASVQHLRSHRIAQSPPSEIEPEIAAVVGQLGSMAALEKDAAQSPA